MFLLSQPSLVVQVSFYSDSEHFLNRAKVNFEKSVYSSAPVHATYGDRPCYPTFPLIIAFSFSLLIIEMMIVPSFFPSFFFFFFHPRLGNTNCLVVVALAIAITIPHLLHLYHKHTSLFLFLNRRVSLISACLRVRAFARACARFFSVSFLVFVSREKSAI